MKEGSFARIGHARIHYDCPLFDLNRKRLVAQIFTKFKLKVSSMERYDG
jgi:hypothetical protein